MSFPYKNAYYSHKAWGLYTVVLIYVCFFVLFVFLFLFFIRLFLFCSLFFVSCFLFFVFCFFQFNFFILKFVFFLVSFSVFLVFLFCFVRFGWEQEICQLFEFVHNQVCHGGGVKVQLGGFVVVSKVQRRNAFLC